MATAVQSVERAFRILGALQNGPSTLSQIARSVDLPVSTTSRLLSTLEGLDAVERFENVNLYRIGSGIVTIASGVDANRSLAALATEELRSAAIESGEAAGVAITSGYVVHAIAEERAETTVQLRDWVDSRLPMHMVASGLVALASWTDDAVDNYLGRELERGTKRSMTDPQELRERIERIRQVGFAWTVDELEDGITAVAAPLVAGSGEVIGGVHIHGPSYRFPGDRPDFFEKLVQLAAERISLLLT